MKVPWPDTFEEEDERTFLGEFKDVEELAGIRSNRVKLIALRALLKGQAPVVLDAARKDPEKMEWAAAKDAPIAGFDTPADHQRVLRNFRTAQLGIGVDPLSRTVALRALLNRALQKLDDTVHSDLILDRLMESLP
ncbi:unnamed protein product [Echinostoma caproni]|uniref:DNA-binding protein n=1 Tax=Echinostoma caproni TaxID=27848 RepID=A0A183AHX5_9TREM|nr:unnamed protein product [Echinostoma caproni]